jgi:endoglucanase Acf2
MNKAVNAYYAVKLYADALNDADLSHFAQLMLTMEIQAAKFYWHVSNYDIYDEKLGASRMIGKQIP